MLSERIKKLINGKGVTPYEISIKTGISQSTLSRVLKEQTLKLNIKNAQILAKYFDINIEWLMTGVGDMLKATAGASPITTAGGQKKEGSTPAAALNNKPQKMPSSTAAPVSTGVAKLATPSNTGIPLIPIEAMAGFGQGGVQVMEYECERYIIPAFKDAEFLISVKGSSMYPKYSSGDIVACKKLSLNTFFQWNKVYVVDTEQGALIKRIKKGTDDNCILLVSENTNYEPFYLPLSQINSLALVVGVIRLE